MRSLISPHFYYYGLKDVFYAIEGARITHHDQETVDLAVKMLELGKALDIDQLRINLARPFDGQVTRDFNNPVDYTSPFILGKPWADDPAAPLEQGEVWNQFNRASNTGLAYSFDADGYPANPFHNYGIKGRGIVGRYGPNHTVDLAPCRIFQNKEGRLAFHVLGIIRHDNKLPALCGGYVNFRQELDGTYPYSPAIAHEAQMLEFCEELVTGSVTLLPRYAVGLKEEIEEAFQTHERDSGFAPTDTQRNIITRELTTHRKLAQIQKEDPQFLQNIQDCFRDATTCYHGPMLSSIRNTNNAWMETHLSWFMMDEAKWTAIKGENIFDYDLQAGDDALEVLWHEVTPELLQNAGSHRQLFCYVIASYLAHSQHVDPPTLNAVKDQAQMLLSLAHPASTAAPSMTP